MRLLTAKIGRLEIGNGGIAEFTQADVGHALGLIKHPKAILIGRVKYAVQKELYDQLEYALWDSAVVLAILNKWKIPKDLHGTQFLRRMAKMALSECLEPQHCTQCQGRGELITENLKIQCESCEGLGHKPKSDRQRADRMNMAKSTWADTWSEPYRLVQIELDKWEDIFRRALHYRLKRIA